MNNVYVTLQNSFNSDGLWYPSISIYYSGCDRNSKCEGCHNPELHKQGIGYLTTTDKIILDIEKNLTDWLTIYPTISICYIGGEPLASWNRKSVLEVSKYFKTKYKDNICNILYSWRYIEDLNELSTYLKYMDFGVLGDFQLSQVDTNYIPTSKNQYIYDFKTNTKLEAIKKG